jgi:surface antigen
MKPADAISVARSASDILFTQSKCFHNSPAILPPALPNHQAGELLGRDIMKTQLVAITMIASLGVAGCSVDSGPKEQGGAVIGGVAGGLLGSTIGHGSGRAAATILGAAFGAIVGAGIGRSLDDQDRERAYEAAQEGLVEGRVTEWENPRTRHRGRFVVVRTFHDRRAYLCRDFQHTIWVGGEPELIEGTACEFPDGSWHVVES